MRIPDQRIESRNPSKTETEDVCEPVLGRPRMTRSLNFVFTIGRRRESPVVSIYNSNSAYSTSVSRHPRLHFTFPRYRHRLWALLREFHDCSKYQLLLETARRSPHVRHSIFIKSFQGLVFLQRINGLQRSTPLSSGDISCLQF